MKNIELYIGEVINLTRQSRPMEATDDIRQATLKLLEERGAIAIEEMLSLVDRALGCQTCTEKFVDECLAFYSALPAPA